MSDDHAVARHHAARRIRRAGGAAAVEPTFQRRVRSRRRLRAEHVRDYGIIVFVVGIFAYFSFASPVFLTDDNLLNIVYAQTRPSGSPRARSRWRSSPATSTCHWARCSPSRRSSARRSPSTGAWWWFFPVAIVSGGVMGLINGLLITKLRVNAFLATLATALAFVGVAVAVTGGLLDHAVPDRVHLHRPEQGRGDPVPRLHLRSSSRSSCQLVLAYTVFGRHLYGVGGNREARPALGPQGRPDRDHHVRHHRRWPAAWPAWSTRRRPGRGRARSGRDARARTRSPASHSEARASSVASARSGAPSSAC